ncbi:hypothetical protein [Blautia sp.]|jgi:hypothetical protein|uniref:hypothetical protein n=2 Tax=Blautia sp. TaxID=1955243 RepID=UPI00280C3C33|nr:hypothetical protein [Blautia sp.]MDY3016906.1 hypothetical protein [Blautia sp.]
MNDKRREKKRRLRALRKAIDMELREHRSTFIVFSILRIMVLVCMIRQVFLHNYESFFLSVLTLVLLYIPSWLQVKLRIEIPIGLEISILCFIFAAEILGEINAFYIAIPGWDTILHTLNGFLCAAVGFSMVLLLNDNENLTFDLSPFFLALLAFCFSMTIGVLWEFFEFSMDYFLKFDMQKDMILHTVSSVMLDPNGANHPVVIRDIADVMIVHSDGTRELLGLGGYLDVGLYDTMKDLFVNFIGAVVFSVIGFFYARGRGKKSVVSLFVPRRKSEDRDYLSITNKKIK